MFTTPEAIHVLVNPKDYNALGRGDLRKIVADLKSEDPDLIEKINTSLNQVYIGDKSLVDLLQDAMQVESDTFHQETFLIDGKYYVIKIDEITIDGKNEKIGNIVKVDGVWYLAIMAYNDDKVFIGWTPIKTLPLSVAEKSGFVIVVEVPTPVPTTQSTTSQLGLPPTDTLGKESDELPIITASPLFKEDFNKIIDSLANLIALPLGILVLLWFIGWTIGAFKPKYLEKGVEKVGKIGKKKSK